MSMVCVQLSVCVCVTVCCSNPVKKMLIQSVMLKLLKLKSKLRPFKKTNISQTSVLILQISTQAAQLMSTE